MTDQRTTNGVVKQTISQSNLDGSLATMTYPSGRTITYATSGAERLLSAQDTANSINYATSALYSPSGSLRSLMNGTNLLSSLYYNSRMQPCRMAVNSSGMAPGSCTDSATGNVLDMTYNFSLGAGDNGNVMGITNNRDTTRSQAFTYDGLNRLLTAQTTSTHATSPSHCWGEQYTIDAWGNMTQIGSAGSAYTGCTQEGLSVAATAQNRLSGYTFDTAGNMTANAGSAYIYDAENRLASTAGVNYTYDGDGKRVQKSNGEIYWYGMDGSVLDETDGSGSTTNGGFSEYIFFGGKRIAKRDSSNNIVYYFADHLGTARVVTNASGTIQDDSDFYPFGGERVITSSSGNRYKFTGKERDSESGLDNFGARYDASTMGRFMSADPLGGSLVDPQTLNKYSYVRNNPINLTDPTGLYTCADSTEGHNCTSDQDKAFEKARQADLKSKDADVVRGASAYGDPTKDNGVSVKFGDPGKGNDGITSHGLGVGPDGKLRAEENVTIKEGLSGSGLDAVVGHEGSHVADAQDFVSTMTMGGNFDVSKNLSKYQTEFKAYMVSNSIMNSQGDKASYGQGCDGGPCVLGFGVGQRQAGNTINQLLANPANGYGVTPKAPGALLYPTLTVPTVPK